VTLAARPFVTISVATVSNQHSSSALRRGGRSFVRDAAVRLRVPILCARTAEVLPDWLSCRIK
jgi:hypothetical protein